MFCGLPSKANSINPSLFQSSPAITLCIVKRNVWKYHSLGVVSAAFQLTRTSLPSPIFSVIVPVALMAMTETDSRRLSKGRARLRVYVDLIAICSPGRMERTSSRYLSSYPFSQIPSSRKRGV